ncbi:MAG TPA: PilZ domain-containing protein [Candidatus Omnitrophota bacterium]|nr:PilZ domain-containing protein [Candidatus Omnitrophota bacterium]MDD5270750.1 PilZ domain-containing protein [Candidatus Omnitrophota bacterium]MDD5737581.1 PilZ domain-containing protein [Candidatus Omnitrophota bacterium]HOX09384.1 PilZ domain-containing protein [Candidatus Omnitrophota bacterium]HRZ66650.1 PilZ domain-containing protein [Candidatus Omnitrophota bacterium]
MGWSGIDTRRSVRVSFECVVIVKKKETSLVFRTQTENISAGGICLILERALLKHTPVEVELFLPDDPIPVNCEGKVAWSVRRSEYLKKKSSQFDTGIEFTSITDEDKARLKRIIEELLEY